MNDIKKNPLLFKALSQHKFNQKLKKSIYKNVNKKGKRKKFDIESVPFSGQVISLNNEVIQKLDINLENFLTMKVLRNKSLSLTGEDPVEEEMVMNFLGEMQRGFKKEINIKSKE